MTAFFLFCKSKSRVRFYPPPQQRRNRRFVYYTLHTVLSHKEHFFMNPFSANFIVIQLLEDLNISYTLLLGAAHLHIVSGCLAPCYFHIAYSKRSALHPCTFTLHTVSGSFTPEYSHITHNERALRAHVLPHYTQ